ncbi:LPXTG cell wall anchor domain-containing protein [Microbacterium aurum]
MGEHTRINRTRRGLVLSALAATLVLVAVPIPAAAADDGLLVSHDGVTYVADSTLPIYPEAWRWVPGDEQTSAVWVRNAGTTDGLLRIDLIAPDADDVRFAQSVAIAAGAPGGGGEDVLFADAMGNGDCTVLSTGLVLAPGESRRIDVTTAVSSALSGDEAAQARLSFALRASLTDAAAGSAAAVGSVCTVIPDEIPSSTGSLPHTGGAVPWTIIALGAAGVTVGGSVFLLGRRRRQEEEMADER